MSDYGHVDVRFPASGTWTAVIFSRVSTSGGSTGPVLFQAGTSNTSSFGSVSPASLTLAPGASGQVTVTAPTGATPGDTSGSLVIHASGGQQSSVPLILRSLVQPSSGGTFTGTLYGGNGRQTGTGQVDFYQFDVPSGETDLDASVVLNNDPSDTVNAFLVDPSGDTQAVGTNQLTTAYNPTARSGTFSQQTGTDLYVRAPKSGRWTLIVKFTGAVAGNEISQAFHGTVGFNKVRVGSGGANQARLTEPAGYIVPVTNTGSEPIDVFVDPRLNTTAQLTLAPVEPGHSEDGWP